MNDPIRAFPDLDVNLPVIPASRFVRDLRRAERLVARFVLIGTVVGLVLVGHVVCYLCLTGQVGGALCVGMILGPALPFTGALLGLIGGKWWTGLPQDEPGQTPGPPPEAPEPLTHPVAGRAGAGAMRRVARFVLVGTVVGLVLVGYLICALSLTGQLHLGRGPGRFGVFLGSLLAFVGGMVGLGSGKWWTLPAPLTVNPVARSERQQQEARLGPWVRYGGGIGMLAAFVLPCVATSSFRFEDFLYLLISGPGAFFLGSRVGFVAGWVSLRTRGREGSGRRAT